MNRLSIFTAATIVATLASPFVGNKAFSQEKYDYGIELLFKTGLNGSSTDPAQDANVTITALDIDMDIQSQTLPLDGMGGVLFSNAYTDIPSALFTTIKYDFKVNGDKLGINIPNVVEANIYNEAGQLVYSKNFDGRTSVSVPAAPEKISGEKLFYRFKDSGGKCYDLRKIGTDKICGYAKSGAWNKTFIQEKDGSKVEIGGKGKATTRYEVKIVPNDGSNMEKTEVDTINVLLQDGRQTFEMYDLEKIKQQKRIMGTVRNLENLNGVDNAKVLVSKMLSDGSFQDLDSVFTDFLGEYTTNRIDIQDSLYLRLKKDGFINTVIRDWGNMIDHDQGYFISKFPMTARTNHADTLQTGKYKQSNVDFLMIPNWNTHPLYASAIAEQNALGNPITEYNNEMFVEGRANLSCQAWRNKERLGIYLVPGEFTTSERDSMVAWLDEEAKATGYSGGFDEKFELLSLEPTDSNASYLRVIKGDNVFSGWEYTNDDAVANGYIPDIIRRGGEVKTYLNPTNKNEALKELTSRVTESNTVSCIGNSNAIPSYITKTDQIKRTYHLKMDANEHNSNREEFITILPPTKLK